MLLRDALNQFYKQYNIPEEGGVDMNSFIVPLGFIKLKLPNPGWRKKKLHIHDTEHIINEQDTSWKGEVFIASWEIATGFWKNFPVCILPLWAIGLGWWLHPSSVVKGTRRGLSDQGIAGLNMSREALLQLTVDELKLRIQNKRKAPAGFLLYLRLAFLFVPSQLVFLSPLWVPAAVVGVFVW